MKGNMLGRILAIAGNTYRENIRDKILYNLILFALIMILSSLALGRLTLGNEAKVILDLGLASISIFGMLIAIFIGISLVYKELEKRTVYALLAKPVHRYEWILGKYLGLLFTLLVNLAVMTVGLALAMLYTGGIQAGAIFASSACCLPDLSIARSYYRPGAALLHVFLSLALRHIHFLSLDHRAFWQRPPELRKTDPIRIHKRAVPGPVLCNSQLVEFCNPGQPQHPPGCRPFPADRSLRHFMGYGILCGVLRIPRCAGHRDLHAPGF